MPWHRAGSQRPLDPVWLPCQWGHGTRLDRCNPLGLGYGPALPLPRGPKLWPPFVALDSDGTHHCPYLRGSGPLTTV